MPILDLGSFILSKPIRSISVVAIEAFADINTSDIGITYSHVREAVRESGECLNNVFGTLIQALSSRSDARDMFANPALLVFRRIVLRIRQVWLQLDILLFLKPVDSVLNVEVVVEVETFPTVRIVVAVDVLIVRRPMFRLGCFRPPRSDELLDLSLYLLEGLVREWLWVVRSSFAR